MCITLTSIWSCIVVHGLSDYSVRSVYLEYIYPMYNMASLVTCINPLLLNGDSLGTSVINKPVMIAQVDRDVYAT